MEEDQIRKRKTNEEDAASDKIKDENVIFDNEVSSHPFGHYGGLSNHPHMKCTYKNSSEYAEAVRQWLNHYQWYQSMAWFYMTVPMHSVGILPGYQQHITPGAAPFMHVPPNAISGIGLGLPHDHRVPPTTNSNVGPTQENVPAQPHLIGTHYRIPPIWKRLVAEFIDFLLLFVIKLAMTIITVEYFQWIDIKKWENYDIETILKRSMDYDTALTITTELIAMEIVNRVFVTLFEALCLRQGIHGVGGTTPGKRAMGLSVVSCQRVVRVDGQQVRVIPAEDLGFVTAFVRSLIKNFSLAFFFPASFTVFFFNHNRALYDIVAGCVVVEKLPNQQQAR